MEGLLQTFKEKNGDIPATVVVYRDGVSDGQFDAVLQDEVTCIKEAIERMGYTEDYVKVAVVICQKGHHTRLVYEERGGGFVNICPGLVVDALGSGKDSISSPVYNEFYLCSHAAIQGTSKPCKYSLIYDEIGLKVRLHLAIS
jgi:eukaryotic translation initiation factor 2C